MVWPGGTIVKLRDSLAQLNGPFSEI